MIDEDRIIELEAQVNELKEQIKRFEQPTRSKRPKKRSVVSIRHDSDRDNYFWGFILIIIGGFWIAKNVGWFFCNISIWPVVIVAVGIYLLVTPNKSKQKELSDE